MAAGRGWRIIAAAAPSIHRIWRILNITGVNGVELQDIDLNLLLVLHQLQRQRRVSAVAQTLGLSQPAVSNALRRLRTLLGDELYLRTPRGMAPTPLAQQLAGPVAEALGLLHGALDGALAARDRFEPATATRCFRLAMTDIGEIYFLPRLLAGLAAEAPGLTLRTVRTQAGPEGDPLRPAMEAGEVDLAVGLLPQLQAGFFQRRLFAQRYVCLLRAGHPLAAGAAEAAPTLAEFAAAEQVQVLAAGTGHGQVDALIDAALAGAGLARRVRLTVPHFVAVGHILAATDLLATVPERFAAACAAPFGLVARPHPVALPVFDIHLFWHARMHRDAGHQWLRERLFSGFGGPAA